MYNSIDKTEGLRTQTGQDGSAAHAEGQGTKAEGKSSHSEGENTTARGNASHEEGIDTSTNSFKVAHIMGRNGRQTKILPGFL